MPTRLSKEVVIMKIKALILTALLMLTSTQTFAATFTDFPNVDKLQIVAMDDFDGDNVDDNDVDDNVDDNDVDDNDDGNDYDGND